MKTKHKQHAQGIDAKVIDNGSHLSGVERWAVQYEAPLKRRQTFSISRKPSGNTLQGKKVGTCSNPRTSRKNNGLVQRHKIQQCTSVF